MTDSKAQVTDAELERVAKAICGDNDAEWDFIGPRLQAHYRSNAQAAIAALAAQEKLEPVVAVRLLDWRLKPGTNDLYAESAVGTYGVGLVHLGFVATLRNVEKNQWKNRIIARNVGLEVAKAAAQADYEQRIRSALVSTQAEAGEPVEW